MKTLFTDFEIRSQCDLKERGVYNYANDPTTEVITLAYCFDKGKIKSVDFPATFADLPEEIKKHKGPIVVQNWTFEYSIFTYTLNAMRHGGGHFADYKNYIDTSALARRNGLPAKLDHIGKALGFGEKHTEGERLINKYSKLFSPRSTTHIAVNDMNLWHTYNIGDVDLMRKIYYYLPGLSDREEKIFRLDQKMNLNGIKFDLKSTRALASAYETFQEKAEKKAEGYGRTATGTLVIKSNGEFLKFLNSRGLKVSNVQKPTLAPYVDNKDVGDAIKLRFVLGASAPKKLQSILSLTDAQGVLRFFLLYYGAHTGRWAGRGVQVQNFVRETPDNWQKTFDLVMTGKVPLLDSSRVISTLLRGLIVPWVDTNTRTKGRRRAA